MNSGPSLDELVRIVKASGPAYEAAIVRVVTALVQRGPDAAVKALEVEAAVLAFDAAEGAAPRLP